MRAAMSPGGGRGRGVVALIALALGTGATAAEAQQGKQPNIGPRVQTTEPMQIQPMGPKPDWASCGGRASPWSSGRTRG
jgi:hypothetical protein